MAKQNKSTFQRLTHRQLNRKQRRELERRLRTEDPGLEIVNRNVAASTSATRAITWPCSRPGRDAQPGDCGAPDA